MDRKKYLEVCMVCSEWVDCCMVLKVEATSRKRKRIVGRWMEVAITEVGKGRKRGK
jgi:hypothetical protein